MIDDVLLAVNQLGRLFGNRRRNLRMCVASVHHADPRGVVEPTLASAVNEPRAFAALHIYVGSPSPDGGDDLVSWDRLRAAHGFRLARRRCRSAPMATSETVATKKRVANAFTCGGIPFCTFR